MDIIKTGKLIYYTFETFRNHNIIHGVFSRHGGVSPKPWDTLNLGGTVGDLRENVIENRRRMFKAINRDVESVFDTWQVHGSDVICTEKPRPLSEEHVKADAILTNENKITLMMRFADCVPILLYDPLTHVIGITHAGWKGTVNSIAKQAIDKMCVHYGSSPKNIIAGIGPSIGPDHYEIKHDLVPLIRNTFGGLTDRILICNHNQLFMNLWEANRIILEGSGVSQIEISEICTSCYSQDWYTHRGEKGTTGRFGAVIALPQ